MVSRMYRVRSRRWYEWDVCRTKVVAGEEEKCDKGQDEESHGDKMLRVRGDTAIIVS